MIFSYAEMSLIFYSSNKYCYFKFLQILNQPKNIRKVPKNHQQTKNAGYPKILDHEDHFMNAYNDNNYYVFILN